MTANRLIHEKSPYLLQHAYNPVDWWPWCQEAFDKAKREGKPVLISCGYSTCHWCHVMAHETFEDEKIADMLNERFVAIKVDREERPDIDAIYMKVCQALTGQGGWPLNVFTTPDQKPFYAGMYFPKESRFGMPGFVDVITQLYEQYQNNPDKITDIGEQITNAFQKEQRKDQDLKSETLHECYNQLLQSFDSTYGGFGNAPKFPAPHQLTFLLRYFYWTGQQEALDMVTKTLDGIAAGGMYDHIGYGFARYATDREWLIPHFEKMLYDQAMLAIAYTEGYQVTKNSRYRKTVEEIFAYVTREMQSSEGGFYSAEDADSEGEEGKFYLWTPEEVIDVLGEEQGNMFCDLYDITENGNFEGENIPHLIGANASFDEEQQLEDARKKLFIAREQRTHPYKDDKILTAWNGLMIAALAKAGRIFGNPDYIRSAIDAMTFIERHLTQNGRLMARYRDGEVKNPGFIDDYAYILWGCIELYETTQDPMYLQKAVKWADAMIDLFWDEEHGGFYFYGNDAETLVYRPKELYDAAIPSGNSVCTLQLLRLSKLTGNLGYENKVNEMFQVFAEEIQYYPSGYSYFLQSLLTTEMSTKEVVVLGQKGDSSYDEILTDLKTSYLPDVTYLSAESSDTLRLVAPFTKDFQAGENTLVYLCENFSCQRPTSDIKVVLAQLGMNK